MISTADLTTDDPALEPMDAGSLAPSPARGTAVLEVDGLTTRFEVGGRLVTAVDRVSLTVQPGEIVAIVGESGSGKSVLLQSILGLVRGRPGVVSGSVTLRVGEQVIEPFSGIEQAVRGRAAPRRWLATVERRFAGVRGTGVGLVLQNGRAALDPFWTVGRQLMAALTDKGGAKPTLQEAYAWLERLGFDHPEVIAAAHPHELSGGMAQRAMLAVVLAREPKLLFLDEITTGLDVSLQASVLKLLRRLHQQVGFSALLITHDLGIARGISQRTVIMRRGRVVQAGDTEALFERRLRLDPYTRELLEQGQVEAMERTDLIEDLHLDAPAARGPLAEADAVVKRFGAGMVALDQVSVAIQGGECVALVGESGSGKTTLSRILVGLLKADAGKVAFDGQALAGLGSRGGDAFRRRRTILFQNPYTSLNPEMRAEEVVAEALVLYRDISPQVARDAAEALLEETHLGHRAKQRLALLSGGERRRVGLVRAMQSNADLIVLDEPTAGLDAVHRRDVAQMIWGCRSHKPDRALVIVSHDLGFVSQVADRIVVLYRGTVVEDVSVNDFLNQGTTHHPYTQLLWDASRYVAGVQPNMTMIPARRSDLSEAPPLAPGSAGCLFRNRCPIYLGAEDRWSRCATERPPLVTLSSRRKIACHGVEHDRT
ncbi:MAG: ABC transporter ATP-binding protein [Myxococcales bacterium]|nr:ABC transporter ATP-binding protein [Myxococcales bacterium]